MVREMGLGDKGRWKTHIVVCKDWKKSSRALMVIEITREVG